MSRVGLATLVVGCLVLAAMPLNASTAIFPVPAITTQLEHGGARAALGDFNEDGRPDIVALTHATDVYLADGLGGGLFAPPRRFNGDTTPENSTLIIDVHSLDVADIDEDGHLDVLNANFLTVHLLVGDGRGGLSPPLAFDMGLGCDGVRAEDLDGDGHLDLFAVNRSLKTISVRLGNGDGTFDGRRAFGTHRALELATLADLDGDRDLDVIATPASGDSLLLRWNDGAGGFEQSEWIEGEAILRFIALTAGDIDGDGMVDLVMTRFTNTYDGGEQLLVRRGIGVGRFEDPQVLPGDYGELTIHDVDRDGVADVLAASGRIVLYRGLGGGTLASPTTLVAAGGGTAPGIADLNGDGHDDFVSSGAGYDLALSEADGGFVTIPQVSLPRYAFSGVIDDLESDGVGDIVGCTSSSFDSMPGTWYRVPGRPDGTLGPPEIHPLEFDPTRCSAGDFDGDGYSEIAIGRPEGGIDVLSRGGDGSYSVTTTLPGSGEILRMEAIDVTGDGRADLVTTVFDSPVVRIVPGAAGGGFDEPLEFAAPGESADAAFADVDGDGRLDMVVAGRSERLFRYLGTGGGGFVRIADILLDVRASEIALADVDGKDGPELVTADLGSLWLFHVGMDGVVRRSYSYGMGYPSGLHTPDLNRDGRADLVVDLDGFTKPIYLGQPDGTLSLQQSVPSAGGRAAIGDLDGDGWMDMAVAAGQGVLAFRNAAIREAVIDGLAATGDDWSVRLDWTVEGGHDGLTFDVFRRASWQAEPVRVNPAPLAAAQVMQFVDRSVDHPAELEYLVARHDVTGSGPILAVAAVTFDPPLSSIRLLRAYPNPFQGSTRVQYEVPDSAPATLEILDIAGRRVRQITLGTVGPGRGEVAWDGRSESGEPCAGGVYHARLVGGSSAVRVVLVR